MNGSRHVTSNGWVFFKKPSVIGPVVPVHKRVAGKFGVTIDRYSVVGHRFAVYIDREWLDVLCKTQEQAEFERKRLEEWEPPKEGPWRTART